MEKNLGALMVREGECGSLNCWQNLGGVPKRGKVGYELIKTFKVVKLIERHTLIHANH